MYSSQTATAAGRPRRQEHRGLPYVAALDGVRAIAVGAVLLYHGGVSIAPGGFLGVDMFFVLSGFLITSLLITERAATGSIDLFQFWLRRARRLLPAAFLVIAVTALVAAIFLPADAVRTRGDAIASLLLRQQLAPGPRRSSPTSRRSSARRCCSTCGRSRSRSSSTCCGRSPSASA